MSAAEFLSNSLISKTEKYHYWFTPKCACTTTKNVMWALESDAGNCEPIEDPRFVHNLQYKNYSPWFVGHKDIASASKDEDRFTFTFVRNPYSRALSGYASVAGDEVSRTWFRSLGWDKDHVPALVEFLELVSMADPNSLDHHWKPLSLLIPLKDIRFDRIGSVENYESDIREFAKHAISQPVDVKFSQKMYHTGFGDKEVSPDVAALVRKIYVEDFERFGYSLNPQDRMPRPTSDTRR
ncbi:sulfotransferase family protein [Methylorubrum thiocyanatum]